MFVNVIPMDLDRMRERETDAAKLRELPELTEGTVVTLMADPSNPKDKNAVRVFLDDMPIGYLANRYETVPQGCVSASKISQNLAKPGVAGANARLMKAHIYQTKKADGEPVEQTHWTAEVFFRPEWRTKDEKKEAPVFTVGGNRVLNGDMATVLNNFSSYKDGDLVVMASELNDKMVAVIYRANTLNDRNNAPAGQIQNPSEDLMLALQSVKMLPVTPVRETGPNSYEVSICLDSANTDEFTEEMDALVSNCILQTREVKERVSYLVGQHVPSKIIHGVLNFIQHTDDQSAVRRPRQLYLQTVDNDCLTRSLGYHLAHRNIRLVGEKGSGKNTLVSSVCWVLNQPLCRVQGNADMDKLDLLGSQALDEHGTTFALSSFVKMLQTGGDVVLDEINAVKPEIAIVLHSLADDARSIEVPGYGFVEVHSRSRIWSTMNEDYVGTGELNSATADRFVPIYMEDQLDLKKLLKEMFPDASNEALKICGTLYEKILKSVRDGKCTSDSITTRGYIDAMEASKWLPLKSALLDNIANRPQDKDDRAAIKSFIHQLIPAGV